METRVGALKVRFFELQALVRWARYCVYVCNYVRLPGLMRRFNAWNASTRLYQWFPMQKCRILTPLKASTHRRRSGASKSLPPFSGCTSPHRRRLAARQRSAPRRPTTLRANVLFPSVAAPEKALCKSWFVHPVSRRHLYIYSSPLDVALFRLWESITRMDDERLFVEVEKYVELYDQCSRHYKDNSKKDIALQAIALEIGSSGEKSTMVD